MVWWGICTRLYYKFPTESNSERILKIGQYLVKLWARVRCLVFLTHGVVLRPDMEAKYCDERVCVSVCLSLRQRNLRNHASSLRRGFVHVTYGRGWLGPPLVALRYLMHS